MAQNFDELTLSLPAHWIGAIFYGDTSDLDGDEVKIFQRWLSDFLWNFGPTHIGDVSSGAHFARYHDAAEYGVQACSCHDITFHTFT
jgi:hypothetical protein